MAKSISVAVGDSDTIREGRSGLVDRGVDEDASSPPSSPHAATESASKSAAISAAVDRIGCTLVLLWSEDLVFADRIGQRPLFLRERVRSCRGSET
jgi:hypothetical protein